MDIRDQKVNANRADDTSFGILNMSSLKGRGRFFGDLTHDSLENTTSMSDRNNSDRLNNERKKALEILQKAGKTDLSPMCSNKENMRVLNNASTSCSKSLDRTDYVPFRRLKSINISDLVTDETIHLETTPSCPSSTLKDNKISFEPSEITGRSTLHKTDLSLKRNNIPVASCNARKSDMSVSDILASSFSQKARNLCDFRYGAGRLLCQSSEDSQGEKTCSLSASTTCSSFTSFNDSKSLPRTEDMSWYLPPVSLPDEITSSSFDTLGENFAPGELMQSKLITDEIAWAEEYATIPAATLSQQAKIKVAKKESQANISEFEQTSSNSTIAGDPNFSVGKFFQMRSENLCNIVKSTSPDKCRSPFALVDEGDTTTGTVNSSKSSVQIKSAALSLETTPEIENKTYTRKSTNKLDTCEEIKESDSGNSLLLSMTAIDRALESLERNSSIAGNEKTDQSIYAQKRKSCMNSLLTNTQRDMAHYGNLQAVSEIILENKENLDPQIMRGTSNKSDLSDTLSFTESILNSSDMKKLQHVHSAQRSPLSPIEVRAVPNLIVTEISEGEEADRDEPPITNKSPNRRVRRTKSPRDKTPLRCNGETEDSSDATTPVNSKNSCYYNDKISMKANTNSKDSKSLCSTRLDGEGRECDFGISPNLSANKTLVRSGCNNTLTNSSPGFASIDNSPLSTTSRSYLLTQASSPTPTNHDVSGNSDRQILSAGVTHKVASPAGSETSSTCSYATVNSARSTATSGTMRSMSRCSSTSEFSHRDGKPIPLKVTATELSWGSVKLRSDSRKTMQIKNINSKRLIIRVEICGPGFQIINNKQSNNITLHSQECRTINISFCPTVPGVAIGKLSFFAPTSAYTLNTSFIDLPLYGYGGSANVMPQKISIGPVGSPFIAMGDICELAQPLQRTVRFYNKGPLLAFAVITVDSLGLFLPHISEAFEIQPQKVLISPRNFVDVQIIFKPKREQIKKIVKKIENVMSLATLRVISGDEPNRQRIRHLLLQMTESERTRMFTSALSMLWTKFPGEEEIKELAAIRENPDVAMDLTSGCKVHEIVLTINCENFDETAEVSSLFLPDGDETVLFRTVICAADSNSTTPTPSNLGAVCEMYEERDDNDHQACSSTVDKKTSSWTVSPSFVDINLKRPEHVSLFVCNGFKSRQYFEVGCNKKNLLRFSPVEGYVAPDNGQTEIVIEVDVNAARNIVEDVFINVDMENERIMVPVKFR